MAPLRVVILSGAGLSAESGIPTFRGADGLWSGYRVEDVATLDAFTEHPERVHQFYNERRRNLLAVEPNPAHFALARLQTLPDVHVFHVTQNIDDLCERAGCRNVLHMHGELLKCRCLMCREVLDWREDTGTHLACPECGFRSRWGGLRPHVVWFGEIPIRMDEIEAAVASCDAFVAIGTSGNVYPAAGYVSLAQRHGAMCTLLNLDRPANAHAFDRIRTGPAAEIVPQWVAEMARR